ncbi:MAG: hypothetical protein ONB48_04700 [candidate division KSB1 bacterium]|nr:hypothetical protein [candidate division KSB1 bacterium]MDZ7274389.1 hypothetical protein [candidate division KSB1 bacterium]MDZ7284949.1 hypothetical protein [candidate division KSB1 bacterium]MDZ7297630.1 hypothetical protein [candidate division KSB1 bacterium]MDZ7306370.1 hypothetical protein [candidate division KSB1 bacterium]
MKFNAPTQVVWLLAVILGVLGILGNFTTIAFVTKNAFWLVTAGFALLAVGTMYKRV